MFCRSLFVLLVIVLYVHPRFTDFDYPFRIFKLFLIVIYMLASTSDSLYEVDMKMGKDNLQYIWISNVSIFQLSLQYVRVDYLLTHYQINVL
jgi:hypothetical protein